MNQNIVPGFAYQPAHSCDHSLGAEHPTHSPSSTHLSRPCCTGAGGELLCICKLYSSVTVQLPVSRSGKYKSEIGIISVSPFGKFHNTWKSEKTNSFTGTFVSIENIVNYQDCLWLQFLWLFQSWNGNGNIIWVSVMALVGQCR